MEFQPTFRDFEPATFSGRDASCTPGLRRGHVSWSKARFSGDDLFEEQRESRSSSDPHEYAYKSFPFWREQARNSRLGFERKGQEILAESFSCTSRSQRRRKHRGKGIKLVVDSNPAFDLASPLLEEVEINWEGKDRIEAALGDRSETGQDKESRSRIQDTVSLGKQASGSKAKSGTVPDARWHVAVKEKAAQLLRHLPWLSPEALNTSKHLLSGALAAAVARTSVAPLERVKIEYIIHNTQTSVPQTVSRILKQEGLGGFWKGNGVNILRTAPFKAVNFYAFDFYRKAFLARKEERELTNWERIAAGAAAGATATVVCFPMDTVRTRLVARPDQFKGVADCFYQLVTKEGPISLYRGLLPGIVSMAPAGAVFYGVYDLLRAHHLRSIRSRKEVDPATKDSSSTFNGPQTELGTFRTLLYGGISGICAEATTYPLEVLRRQLQLQGARGIKLGLGETIKQILQQGGPGAFYAGLLPSSMQVIPSAALSYYVYEVCKNLMSVT